MKQSLIIIALLFLVASSVSAQKLNVPSAVTKAFTTKFPGATNVKWGKENAKEYEAEFTLNGTKISANFHTDGSWVETETTIKESELPVAVAAAIKKNYPGAVVTLAEKVEQPGNKTQYEMGLKVKGKKKTVEMKPDGTLAK